MYDIFAIVGSIGYVCLGAQHESSAKIRFFHFISAFNDLLVVTSASHFQEFDLCFDREPEIPFDDFLTAGLKFNLVINNQVLFLFL
jgi:hypothetical protein